MAHKGASNWSWGTISIYHKTYYYCKILITVLDGGWSKFSFTFASLKFDILAALLQSHVLYATFYDNTNSNTQFQVLEILLLWEVLCSIETGPWTSLDYPCLSKDDTQTAQPICPWRQDMGCLLLLFLFQGFTMFYHILRMSLQTFVMCYGMS